MRSMIRVLTTYPHRVRACTVALSVLMLGQPGCGRVDVDALLGEAAAAAAQGNFHMAAAFTDQCVDAQRENITALVLHGFCSLQTRQPVEALEALDAAAAMAPDDFIPQFFHGWALCRQRQFGDALTPLRRAYELREQYPALQLDLLVLLGTCCLEQKLGPEGIEYLAELRKNRAMDRAPEVHNALGIMHLYMDQHREAEQSFLVAHEKDEASAIALQNLAVLHDVYLNEPEKAMRYYRRSLAARQQADDSTGQADIMRRLSQLARERLRPSRGE